MKVRNMTLYHVLYGVSELVRPETYLEIGVREGGSLLSVMCNEPSIAHFILASGIADGRTRLTPTIVRRVHELYTVRRHLEKMYLIDNLEQTPERKTPEHIKRLMNPTWCPEKTSFQFFAMDSHKALDKFIRLNPGKIVDLVLVDGGHDKETVEGDLMRLKDRFKVMVCHDVNSPDKEYFHMPKTVGDFVKENGYTSFRAGQHWFGSEVIFNMGVYS